MKKILIIIAVFLFQTPIYGQSQQFGDDEFLVPISLDNPFELDPVFLNSLWGDLYQRKFSSGSAAIWHGAYVDEDASDERMAILLESQSGVLSVPRDPDHVTFIEIARFPIAWIPVHQDTFWANFTDPYTGIQLPPLEMSTTEYADAVVVRYFLPDGGTRLVAGFTSSINVDVLSPSYYAGEVDMENFWPLKRFFAESQATNYAASFADDYGMAAFYGFDPESTVGFSGDPCASHTDPIDAALCYCLENLKTAFNADLTNCNFPPDGFTSALKGGGAGFAVGTVGVGIWAKLISRVNAVVGTGVVIGTTVAGAVVGFEYEQRACTTRAKSKYNRDWNIAQNNAQQAKSQGVPFTCPGPS